MKGRTQNLILNQIYFRAPNWVSVPMIVQDLSGKESENDINKEIESLISANILIEKTDDRQSIAPPLKYLKLATYEGLPVRDSIIVGDTEVHRIIANSSLQFFPEEFNNAVESLAKYNDKLETRFKNIVKKEQAEYWRSIVSVFGIFVGILALVFTSVLKVEKVPSLNFLDSFLFNLSQILPLFLALLILLIVIIYKR